jgi:hypothetical protein
MAGRKHDEIVMFLSSGCWCAIATVSFDVGKARDFPQLPALLPHRKDST